MPTVTRITVSVADLARGRALYERSLGIPLKYELPGMAMLVTSDGVEVQLHQRTPTPGDAGVAVSFGVEDVDAATAAAIQAGASVVKEPADQAWGERQSVLRDADGHTLCLVRPI
jgi:catechol 2,3-dioxygenase-like lactoylglutathione lyase family enzyme